MKNTERFSNRVQAYLAARPGYPDALGPTLKRVCALRDGDLVADLGSGTGLSSLPFLQAGLCVAGVEPNAEMRAAGEAALQPWGAQFRSVAAPAEATGLAAGSVQLAVAGQAFHWFDKPALATELRRILVPGAQLALFWNIRDHDDPFIAAYDAVLAAASEEYRQTQLPQPDQTLEDKHRASMAAVFGHTDWQRFKLSNAQWLDREGLVQRASSASYSPAPDSVELDVLRAALHKLFDAHARDGLVRIPMTTWVFHAALR